jgi:hypothetical protein
LRQWWGGGGIRGDPKEGARGQGWGHEDGAGGNDGGASTEDFLGLREEITASMEGTHQQGHEGSTDAGQNRGARCGRLQ